MLNCRMIVVVVSFVTRMPSGQPYHSRNERKYLTSSTVARKRRREEDRE